MNAEPPLTSFLKSMLIGGGPVNAGVELNGFALFNNTVGFKLFYPMIASVQQHVPRLLLACSEERMTASLFYLQADKAVSCPSSPTYHYRRRYALPQPQTHQAPLPVVTITKHKYFSPRNEDSD